MFLRREIQVKLAKPTKAPKEVSTPATPVVDAATAEAISRSTLQVVKGVAISIGSLMVLNAACTIAVNAAPKN